MTDTNGLIHHAHKAFSAINTVVLEGHVGQDPKSAKESPNSFSTFSLAFNEKYKKDKETITKTTWIPVVCYGSLADIANLYITKGAHVLIEGRLSSSTWTDKSGQTRTDLQLVGSRIRFLNLKNDKASEETSK